KDVAHEYVHMATDPAQVRHLVDRAIRIARAERTVTCLIIPNDLQEEDAVPEVPRAHGTLHSGPGYSDPSRVPDQAALHQAAEILNAGERVAILAGQGALGATDEVIEVADLLGAGVAKALLGKAALPDDLPFVTGSIGLLGTKPSYDLMTGCDTLLMVGSSFPYAEFLPEEGDARGVQIDIDARMIGIRYPMEVNLVGDSAQTLRALIPLLKRKTDRAWREEIESGVAKWWEVLESRAMKDAKPINPQRVFWELSSRLPDDCILSADSGTAGWSDPRLIVLVLNNQDLNQVTWEQRALQGDPKFEASQTLPDFPYARYADLIGLRGIRVESPEEIAPAWDAALGADRPVVIEAVTDPEVPPLPPHITFDQAKAITGALLGRDPGSLGIIRQSLRDKLSELTR
ncbi:MAG: thiamine pyrophosphate-requiring protein, partial [Actinobacteria bacterium]|nr:thiamine pyrophosphate-requiring protein [Actinomycetota bacterium]